MKPQIACVPWSLLIGIALATVSNLGSESAAAPRSVAIPVADLTTNAAVAAEAPVAKVQPQLAPLPPGVNEVVDLAQRRVGDTLLLEYIKNSTDVFDLSADQIIYLKDLGISEPVIEAMLRHGRELPGQNPGPAPSPDMAAAGAPPVTEAPPQPAAIPATAPTPTETPFVSAPVPAAALPLEAPTMAAQPVDAQPVTQDYSYFYPSLAPYGTWLELPGYGWCWQPTCAMVDPVWQPYCDSGWWVNSDCGWYWHSTYSWGWAPFHYGNWWRHPRCGWVWVPGHTWAPAWVTWRYTDAYCGWAPLPPGCGWSAGMGLTYHGAHVGASFSFGLGFDCFTFVSYHHFCDPGWSHHRLPHREVVNAYAHSTVINSYGIGDHHAIVNHGIAPSRIQAVTGTEVRKVQLREVASRPDVVRQADRFEGGGSTLAVYRPQAAPGAPPPRVTPVRRAQETRPPTTGAAVSHLAAKPSPLNRPAQTEMGRTPAGPPSHWRSTPTAAAPTGRTPAPVAPATSPRYITRQSTPPNPQPLRSEPAFRPAPPSPPVRQPTAPATVFPAPYGNARNSAYSAPSRVEPRIAQPPMPSSPPPTSSRPSYNSSPPPAPAHNAPIQSAPAQSAPSSSRQRDR